MAAYLPVAVVVVAMIMGLICAALCTKEPLVMDPTVLLLIAISIYIAGAATPLCIFGGNEEHDLVAIYICPSGSKAHKTKDCKGGELYYCPRPLALHRAIQIEWCSHCK